MRKGSRWWIIDGLIEAYWNVNVALVSYSSMRCIGLIEAYWNVNSSPSIAFMTSIAWFNRSILKCKWRGRCAVKTLHPGLIEAYWNVNILGEYMDNISFRRFNRSILKCKSIGKAWFSDSLTRFNRSILKCKYGQSVYSADMGWVV